MPSYMQGQIVDKRLGLDVQISYPSELVGEITGKEEPIKSSCINEDEQRGRTWFWKTSRDRGERDTRTCTQTASPDRGCDQP